MQSAARHVRRGACVGAALVLFGPLHPLPAAAQPGASAPEPAAEDRRTELYREGVNAAAQGDWSQAKERFRAALAIRVSPKVVFSLAQAEQHLGQWASARTDYARAVEEAHVAGESDVVRNAEQAARALEARVPHVRIVVTGSSRATATLDDQPVAIGEVVAVDPGGHRLEVSGPDMRTVTASVAVGEGQSLEVPVRLEARRLAAPAPPSSEPRAPPSPTPPVASATRSAVPWRAVGVVATGVGVAGLAVGTAFAFVAQSKNAQSYANGCGNDVCTDVHGYQLRNDALTAATAATVAYVAGGVIAAGGLALWLFGPSRNPGVSVAPVATRTGGVLALAGVFP